MTAPVAFPSARTAVIDYLDGILPGSVTVSATYPTASLGANDLVLQVALDGTPVVRRPVEQWSTIRLTAWATNPTPAEDLLALAQAHLLVHPATAVVRRVTALTGPLAAVDRETGLHTWSATFRVQVRYTHTLPTL